MDGPVCQAATIWPDSKIQCDAVRNDDCGTALVIVIDISDFLIC